MKLAKNQQENYLNFWWFFSFVQSIAEILTSNSVGTQLFFLGCNQDNNCGSNFMTKKENLLGSPGKGN